MAVLEVAEWTPASFCDAEGGAVKTREIKKTAEVVCPECEQRFVVGLIPGRSGYYEVPRFLKCRCGVELELGSYKLFGTVCLFVKSVRP